MYDVLIFLTTQLVIQLFAAEPAGLLSHMSMSHGMTRQGWTGHSTSGFAMGILWHPGGGAAVCGGLHASGHDLPFPSTHVSFLNLFLSFSLSHFVQVDKWFILWLVMLITRNIGGKV